MATVDISVAAVYVDPSHVICPLPDIEDFSRRTSQTTFAAIQYALSVSTDGDNFGESLGLIVYDGSCIECDEEFGVNSGACYVEVISFYTLFEYT